MILRESVRLSVRTDQGARTAAAWLSGPPGADVLLVLVHGGFCNHSYWDGPWRPETYSIVAWAAERGVATLNLDRLGSGESDHPPGEEVDARVGAATLAGIVAQCRAGAAGGRRFAKVVLAGHSYGSLLASLCQADYAPADAVVMTGVPGANVLGVTDTSEARALFLHGNPPAAGAFGAPPDDEAYRAMPARRRAAGFFNPALAEPEMIAADAAAGGTMTTAERRTMGLAYDAGARIAGPVLVQMGRLDRMCFDPKRDPDASRVHERARAMAPANFTFAPLAPDAGHNLAQHPRAREGYDQMLDWLRGEGVA